MGVETATFISQLSATNPLATDPISEGDDQIRLVKEVLQAQFTSLGAAAVTGTAAELNLIDGYTGTTAELNTLDVTTQGTAEASKVVTSDGSLVTNFADGVVQRPELKDYSETVVALSAAATVDIDVTTGNVFTLTPDQNTTFTFSNPSPTGKSCSFTLIWTQDGSDRTIAWPASVDWKDGSAPDVTSGSAKRDVYTFFTIDAGTIWYGFQAGTDMSYGEIICL